ncbi:hypothetical protein GGR51DRAFT_557913 [Nemania sp. FL0031]|nr:hypothetical protein GGR51DRAFT_557913 [Nemania sp. FL0031]
MSYNMSSTNASSQTDLLLHHIANRLAEDRATLREIDKTITRIEKKLDQLEAARGTHQVTTQPEQQPRSERPYPWSQLPYEFGTPRAQTPPPRAPLEGGFSATSTPSKRKPASLKANADELRHSVSKLSLDSQSSVKPPFARAPRNIVPLDPSDFPALPSSPSIQQSVAKTGPDTKPLSIQDLRTGSTPDIPGSMKFPEAQPSPIRQQSSLKHTTGSSDPINRTASSTPSTYYSLKTQQSRPVSRSPSRVSVMPQPQPSIELSKDDKEDDKDGSDAAL